MGYNNMTSFFKTFCAVSFAGILSACSTMNNNEAAPEKYSDLHFDNKKPIELMVKKIEVKSEFTHLLPVQMLSICSRFLLKKQQKLGQMSA